ncbi:PAS domain S-box protein [Paenibacillus antarcticus]|uniref:PAS domain S-box protein n=2 Tax=Paenibacillus antarcticus TaxID=253703 RepID=A0A168JYW3_9BACL|nr:PAS domain S-box protein [Paenibacillus antarcticus]
MEHLQGTYNMSIVALSYIIAVVSSYVALDLTGRVSASRSRNIRMIWLIGGAVFMGFGIWSMHFVGMLAYKFSTPVSYDFVWVVISIITAILSSFIALYAVGRDKLGFKRLLVGGTLMAIGIASMHYIGMTAMRVSIYYEPRLFSLSIAIAFFASVVALWLSFFFRKEHSWKGVLYKLGSGIVMGAAIAGMHYTGMAAARFRPGKSVEISSMKIDQEVLAYIIALGTLIILAFVMFGIFLDKRLTSKDDEIINYENWYKSLYDNHLDGIITVDIYSNIIDINLSVNRIMGITMNDYLNRPASVLLELFAVQYRERARELFMSSLQQGQLQTMETEIIHRDGHLIQLNSICVPVIVEGEVKGTYLIFRDISVEKRSKAKIQHMAYHDELTGLPNRRLLKVTLEEVIHHCKLGNTQFALLYLDIDRFKIINDSLGHSYGDQFLLMVSERLHSATTGMQVTIARMGGDEFTLICHADQVKDTYTRIAERLIDLIQMPYRLKDSDFYVSASIGVAIYPEHGVEAEQLIKNADTAMYEVKRNGKNGFQYYSSQLDEHVMEKVELEADLRKAIIQNELLIHYQPQINLRTMQIIGVEALLRWKHSKKGIISPEIFIPIAEETGLIDEIGAWVLREACFQMKQWQQQYYWNIPVSVNLSTQQFHQKHLVKDVENILNETRLSPKFLELEITESMMMDVARSSQILSELSGLGIRLSMDDFGTGYSSLSYLKLFPIHKIKIDRSFINDITTNDEDRAIVATIITMANNLKMSVIAEGVETKEQIQWLMENGCDDIQGYYFSKPIPASEIERLFIVPLISKDLEQSADKVG